jgi:hypothetical protein
MENLTLECREGVPTVGEFLTSLQTEHKIVLFVPIVFCIMTLVVYVINLLATFESERRETKGNVATLFTIYPVS